MVESENAEKNCFVIGEPEDKKFYFSSVVEFQKSTYSKEIIIFCE